MPRKQILPSGLSGTYYWAISQGDPWGVFVLREKEEKFSPPTICIILYITTCSTTEPWPLVKPTWTWDCMHVQSFFVCEQGFRDSQSISISKWLKHFSIMRIWHIQHSLNCHWSLRKDQWKWMSYNIHFWGLHPVLPTCTEPTVQNWVWKLVWGP